MATLGKWLKNIAIGIGVLLASIVALAVGALLLYLLFQIAAWLVIAGLITAPFWLVGWLIYKASKAVSRPKDPDLHLHYHDDRPIVFEPPRQAEIQEAPHDRAPRPALDQPRPNQLRRKREL